MESMQEIEKVLTDQLLSRGLGRVAGQLAFMHKGQAVVLKADTTIYRGCFITVTERGHNVREFRSGAGPFDWDGIAAVIMHVAERRLLAQGTDTKAVESGDVGKPAEAGLWKTIGAGLSSHLSLEPLWDNPGRVRVRMRHLDLDYVEALQLYAAVSRVLSPAN